MTTAYELARKELGTVEWGKGSNPVVVKYYADAGNAGVKDDAVAWCAAFVGAMIKRAGGVPTGSLAARSYLQWGRAVDRIHARPGDIVVFKRGNSTWQGHVAFFVKDNGATLSVLGGNQSNSVSIAPYPASSLLGIRRGAEPAPPKPVVLPSGTTAAPVQTLWAAVLAFFKGGK